MTAIVSIMRVVPPARMTILPISLRRHFLAGIPGAYFLAVFIEFGHQGCPSLSNESRAS